MRQEDIAASFVQAVDKVISLKPDLCVHSGDLFHSVRPSNKILAIAGEQLYRLAVTHRIPTVVIAGNHDSPRQAHLDAALRIYAGMDNLYVATGGSVALLDLEDCRVVAVPHTNDPVTMKQMITAAAPDTLVRYNVLVAHGVASDMPQFSMMELGEMELPTEALQRFDYTALGHYHNFTRVAERVYYAGSTDRLSLSERDAAKGILEVELEPFAVTFHELQTRPMFDLPAIDAGSLRGDKLAELVMLRIAEAKVSEAILRVTLTGVTQETLNTLPAQFYRDLRQAAFSVEVRMERATSYQSSESIGRSSIGRLDEEFAQYLAKSGIGGAERDALVAEASHLFAADE